MASLAPAPAHNTYSIGILQGGGSSSMDAVDLAGPDRAPVSSGDFHDHNGGGFSGPGSGASERSSGADHARSDSLKGNPNHLNSLNNAGLAKPPAKISAQERAVRIALVGGDCFLIGLQPILTHMSKNKSGKFSYSPVSVNFLVEVAKVLFSVGLLCCIGGGKGDAALRKDKQALLSVRGFLAAAHKNRLLMVPALLYSANNYLKFAMQLYFAPATVKMLSNLKVVSIALLLKLIMKRTFSILQWEALFLLLLGITINQLSCTASSPAIAQLEAESAKNPVAWVYTLASCTIPAAASVFNEYALKKNFQTSVHLQNFFMYFYGLLFNLAGLLATNLTTTNPAPIFSGYSRVTLILVVNNAMQGILSSLFFKFADTILKKYSSTVATILTALMSAALFGHSLSMHFAIGVSMVFVSMHQFFTTGKTIATEDKAAASRGTFSHSPSMDHLQLHNSGATSARHRTSGAILPR